MRRALVLSISAAVAALLAASGAAAAACRLDARTVLQRTLLGEYRFLVPSTSMQPTLPIGSVAAVRPIQDAVRRGDVVAVCLPEDGVTIYLKRVVAVGGDRVRLVDNRVVLSGAPIERAPRPDLVYDDGLGPRRLQCWRESLDGRSWRACVDPAGSPLATTPEIEVPPGRLFLLGDNRDNSADSRTDRLGLVPAENVVGRVEAVVEGGGRRPIDAE